ncbi:hypothetical protein AMK26_34675 [Streptomyces sp. CB03234]|uniref:ATP-binding protein n=1 Tax=Streptomyces sp. (strain CB03234) TaxID=1703937 RepID=UPI0009393A8D|nr:ATP-binding protein [Streptomyces sp. CB03234]OKJ92700.1 hypothetical protein AMK26_34675 [Streptomyces sp. CB03234]
MARDFFCERLVLTSVGGVREVDLAYQLVCVFGPVDTGKTTLVDCIQYALGLPVAWREVPEKRLQTVTLFVWIEGMRIGLRRSLVGDTKSIELLDGPVVRSRRPSTWKRGRAATGASWARCCWSCSGWPRCSRRRRRWHFWEPGCG